MASKFNISGENIKKAREDSGMTQLQLAAAMEVDYNIKISRSNISEIEKNKRRVPDYELKAIAEILNVDIKKLVSD